jgi:hypothetical protein
LNRSAGSGAVGTDDFAPAVLDSDDAKLRISRFGVKFSGKTSRDALMPGLFGDAVNGIDTACQVRADQAVQRGCGFISRDIAAGPGRVGFEIGYEEPRMRLDAIEDARQKRLFQTAIAQPSDRGYRDRDQHDHRDD